MSFVKLWKYINLTIRFNKTQVLSKFEEEDKIVKDADTGESYIHIDDVLSFLEESNSSISCKIVTLEGFEKRLQVKLDAPKYMEYNYPTFSSSEG